jgi:hypothetical protein
MSRSGVWKFESSPCRGIYSWGYQTPCWNSQEAKTPQKKDELGINLLINYALKKGKVIVTRAISSPSKWAINDNSTM